MRHAQGGFDERVQATCLQRRIQFGQQSAHQAQMYGADHVTVLLGSFAERAVVQQDLPFAAGRHAALCPVSRLFTGARISVEAFLEPN